MAIVFCGTAVTDLYVHHWFVQLFIQSVNTEWLLTNSQEVGFRRKGKTWEKREVTWVSGIQSPSKLFNNPAR